MSVLWERGRNEKLRSIKWNPHEVIMCHSFSIDLPRQTEHRNASLQRSHRSL